ncbi:MAG: U32 family peptidase, partial [Methanoregulaceae archaeon]|nr:U32 family peptidase [Methanoregulaceae archaeon]
MPELLAPAGSWESLLVAVNAGADAIYLSGKRFGARNYAANFEDETLSRAISFSHLRGVKVYVAVNTLIHDAELPEALEFLVHIYRLGADAVLIQDIGLAALARRLVPGLVIHASTQLTLHNREGVEWAASRGFRRVVLARELPAHEIERIGETLVSSGIGLEIFIHGALCYCYSGQCLLSSVMGGRSGNRGMCAQPCRKPFELVAGSPDRFGRPGNLACVPTGGRYLLSTKDISVYPVLDRIVRLPVAALKIEGRMRTPQYVAAVVSVYRNALNQIAEGNWTPSEHDIEDLTLAFNRGFTRGYILDARYPGIMGRERPDNRGLCVGIVVSASSGTITIHLDSRIVPETGDGLVVIDRNGTEEGIVLFSTPVPYKGTIRIAT